MARSGVSLSSIIWYVETLFFQNKENLYLEVVSFRSY